jgi:hypothetical protein
MPPLNLKNILPALDDIIPHLHQSRRGGELRTGDPGERMEVPSIDD